jgi:cytochrome b561
MRLFSPAAVAVAVAAASTAAHAAPPAWTVNKAASRIAFTSAFEGAGFVGQFERWNAQIAFDPKDLAASKAVVTIDTGSAKTGDADRDEALPSNDWFGTSKFPTATFASTGFKSLGGDRYEVSGNLTLKGVSRPVTLPFTLKTTGKTATADGVVSFNRTLFNVGSAQFRNGDSVPLDVRVTVHVVATRP